jgi:predicted Zn-dependent protease
MAGNVISGGPLMKKGHFPKPTFWWAFLVILSCLTSCATNPVTGRQELMLLSESSEIRLGRQTDEEIANTYGFYDAPTLNAYIDRLGQQVAQDSHRSHLSFQFKVLDTPVINAFAVPGGFIYLTRGILAHLNSEAEVAGVIGHEIGHVAARHSAQQYTRATVAQLGLGLGTVLSDEFAALSKAAQFGVQMLFLKYSRDNERQADRLGVEYATRAGYDAYEMAGFFHTLEQLHTSSNGQSLPDWFSTHPAPAERVTTVQALAVQQAQIHGLRRQDLQVNRASYLRAIDGMVYGEDPRQGYVDESVFYHPQLRFSFPVPAGWQLTNSPARVQMVNPEKSAAILFSIDPESSPARAAQRFVAETDADVHTSEGTTVNSLPARMLVADIRGDQHTLRVMCFFISLDKKTYAFVGFCSSRVFSTQRPAFHRTMTGFAALSDPRRLNVSPSRVRVFSVDGTTTLRDALQSQGVEDARLQELALLNGKALGDPIPANRLLKWVEEGTFQASRP